MTDITKRYSNGEVTIVWKPSLCSHAKFCWDKVNGLPEVFDPRQRPWIKPHAAETARIIEQVKQCPSGALSFFMNEGRDEVPDKDFETANIVESSPNGPLLVHGNIQVKEKGGSLTPKSNVTAFCRCGASANKPYCDGSHTRINFQG